jgi:DNA-binding CsgD family transcriptional regulator/tetratricopeptide (TPR) repeat protein
VDDVQADSALHSQWPLTGRAEPLARITATLRSPSSNVVLLTGASGIGKSRLAAEAAAVLADDNWLVIPVAASTMMASIPLGALAPAISTGRSELETVGHDPIALFELARRAVLSLAAGRRVVMVVDDLTLLDPLSLTVVTQLIASGAVRVIATVRSGEPVPDSFLAMWTRDSALRIEVPPLGIEDCETLLGAVLGAGVSHRTTVELHRLAGGNTLFLRELVIGAVADDQLRQHEGIWQLVGTPLGTPALHDLIHSRLGHLDAVDRGIVQRLAICQPLAVDDLAFSADMDRLVALEKNGILLVGENRGRIELTLAHPQYAEAVRSSLSRLQVMQVLVAQADAVAARTMTPEDELRVTVWRLDAGRPADPDILSRAAHLAYLAADHPTVARLAAAAIVAGAPAAEMLFLQGEAAWVMGRNSEALALLEQAAEEDEAAPTTIELTGQIATARASTYAGEPRGNSRGIEVLDAASTRHPGLTASLDLARAVLLLNLERATAASEALSTARPSTASESARRAILDLSNALPLSARGLSTEALVAARAAVAHATTQARPAFALRRAQMVLATVLLQAGQLDEARRVTVESLHDSIGNSDELSTRYNELLLGQCYLAAGRLVTAARWFRDVISGAKARGPIAYMDQASALLSLALLWQGDATGAADVLLSLDTEFAKESSTAAIGDGWLASVGGSRAEATAALVERAAATSARGHVVLAANMLHAVSRLGAAPLAAAPLAALAGASSSATIAAQASHAAAEAEQNRDALVAVAARWESIGCLLFAAEALVSAATIARRNDQAREAMGLQNRADALLVRCEKPSTPLLQFSEQVEPLTKREREIAALAASGLTSVEIAERLFLSPRTVNNHLQASYAKLGIRGRGELTGR